jgi:hypothetical protein
MCYVCTGNVSNRNTSSEHHVKKIYPQNVLMSRRYPVNFQALAFQL